jgi:tight adherence protein B
MMRSAGLLLLLVAVALLARAAAAMFWPRVVARIDATERVYAERLKDLFRPMTNARTIAIAQHAGPLAFAVVIFAMTGNPVFAVVIPAVTFLIPGIVFKRLRQQRLAKVNRQLPDALRVMADSAKAGLSLPHMIRMVATQGPKPIAEEFGLIVHAMDLGDSVDDALDRVGARLSLPNFDLMAISIVVNRDRGGDIGQLFGRLAESIRGMADVEEKIETETASVRMSAKIMVGTIPVFALALFVMDPAAVGMLFSTPLGAVVLVAVAALATTGYQMIQRLANPEI